MHVHINKTGKNNQTTRLDYPVCVKIIPASSLLLFVSGIDFSYLAVIYQDISKRIESLRWVQNVTSLNNILIFSPLRVNT